MWITTIFKFVPRNLIIKMIWNDWKNNFIKYVHKTYYWLWKQLLRPFIKSAYLYPLLIHFSKFQKAPSQKQQQIQYNSNSTIQQTKIIENDFYFYLSKCSQNTQTKLFKHREPKIQNNFTCIFFKDNFRATITVPVEINKIFF